MVQSPHQSFNHVTYHSTIRKQENISASYNNVVQWPHQSFNHVTLSTSIRTGQPQVMDKYKRKGGEGGKEQTFGSRPHNYGQNNLEENKWRQEISHLHMGLSAGPIIIACQLTLKRVCSNRTYNRSKKTH